MAENTAIEWADHTFNPWVGCQPVSPEGCKNCYAEALVTRFGGDFLKPRRTGESNWKLPVRWNARAEREGRRYRVFCASMADVFDNRVPPVWRADLFTLIGKTPYLDWLLLTKRIGNASAMMPFGWQDFGAPRNVWVGATVVNQMEADRDIPKLLATPAAVRFLSIEPMLGPIDLLATGDTLCRCEGCLNMARQHPEHAGLQRVDWVICGGESGPRARPMNPDWARGLRDQCKAAGVPFMFKQWGEWGEADSIERTGLARHGWFEQSRDDGGVPRKEWAAPIVAGVELASMRPEVFRVGKKPAGRLLDGQEHSAFPEAIHG